MNIAVLIAFGMHRLRVRKSCLAGVLALLAAGAAGSGLWEEGQPRAEGWLLVDWFGLVKPVGDWIYHTEQGWQYCVGDNTDSLYIYDTDLGAWNWTGKRVFPWIYWYAPVDSWTYFLRPGTPQDRWYYHAAAGADRHQSQLAQPVFRTGAVAELAVNAPGGNGPVRVTAPGSGHVFEVPEHATGQIRIAPLEAGPAGPMPGSGWMLEVSGLEEVELVLDGDPEGNGDYPLVYAYGPMQGAFDDSIGYADRWVALPAVAKEPGKVGFVLPLPEPVGTPASFAVAPEDGRPRATPAPPKYYWVSRISGGTPEAEQRMYVGLQVSSYVAQLLDTLEPGLRGAVEQRRVEKHLSIAYGGNYYTGFNKLRISGWGRRFYPVITITSPLGTQALAHETGHYLTHLLVGHAVYDQLEAAGGSIFSGAHGIRDAIGRTNLLEDYAYYLESFLIGTGGNYVLEQPHITFGGLSPLTKDFPGLEGFSATMLAMLKHDGGTVRDHLGNSQSVQPLALPESKVLEIISRGATSVGALRQQIAQSLGAAQQEAFAVLLQRLGWSYSVRGRLVDSSGAPLANAGILNIKRLGDGDDTEEFVGGWTNRPSLGDGTFSLVGDVFGGSSLLQLTLESGAAIEVPITVDWNQPTDHSVDLGDIVVETNALYRTFSVDYQGLGSGWPTTFTVTMGGDLKFIIEGGEAGAMRIERNDYYGGNTVNVRLRVYIPASAGLRIEGSLHVIASAMSGTDTYDYFGTPKSYDWDLRDYQRFTGPEQSVVSQEGGVVVFDHTTESYGSGWRGGITVSELGTFYGTDKDGTWRMASYTVGAGVQVVEE